jgi:hypothetical protein
VRSCESCEDVLSNCWNIPLVMLIEMPGYSRSIPNDSRTIFDVSSSNAPITWRYGLISVSSGVETSRLSARNS